MRTGSPDNRTQSSIARSTSSDGYRFAGIQISPFTCTKKRQLIAIIHSIRADSVSDRIGRAIVHKIFPAIVGVFVLIGCETAPDAQRDINERLQHDRDRAHDVRVALIDQSMHVRFDGKFDVIYPGDKAHRQIHEIAFFTFEGGASDEATALGAMIERARQLGCEGLLLRYAEAPNSSLAIAHPLWQNPGERVFRASAFIYTP